MESYINNLIKQALAEDAPNGDITVDSLIPEKQAATAQIIAKESGIFFGHSILDLAFKQADKHAIVTLYKNDGDAIKAGDLICRIESNHNAILLVERSALNLIQRLSAIATLTKTYADTLNNPKIKLLDTRKTTVGLRALEKAAIVAGGGSNHRMGLSDMVLIKENHLSILEKNGQLDKLAQKLEHFKAKHPTINIEIEIETLEQLKQFPLHLVQYILLDNFSLDTLKSAISYCRTHYPNADIECSGGITLDTIQQYSDLDIDRLSIGALTHSVTAFDFSLLMEI